jgi:hypothetical protein
MIPFRGLVLRLAAELARVVSARGRHDLTLRAQLDRAERRWPQP